MAGCRDGSLDRELAKVRILGRAPMKHTEDSNRVADGHFMCPLCLEYPISWDGRFGVLDNASD
jgi:hypothetical protein